MLLRAVGAAWVLLLALAAVRTFDLVPVASGSMEPALCAGDVCVTRRAPVRVSEGDIVLFSKAHWPNGVLHRVVARTPGGALRMRGDANQVADREEVPPDAVLGRVVAVLPVGRLAASWSGPRSLQ